MQVYNSNRIVLYYPMFIVVGYLLVTLMLFCFGPIGWPIDDSELLYIFIFAYIFSFIFGYLKGIIKAKCSCEILADKENDLFTFTQTLLPVAVGMFVIVSMRNYGYSSFDILGLLDSIAKGMSDIGGGYLDKINRAKESINGADVFGGTLLTIFIYIWDFFDYNILLLAMFFFQRGGFVHKVLTIVLCSMTVVYFFANGTNIGVFRIILAIFIFYVFAKMRNRGRQIKKRLSFGKKLRIIVLLIGLISVFIFYFSNTMMSRGAYDSGAAQLIRYSGMQLRQVGGWQEFLPDEIYYPFLAITAYSTQGYYGMSLALKEEWTPMFGLGSNTAIVDVLGQFYPSILESTYAYKIEDHYNWSSKIQWASFYTWIANDVSFIGVIVVMFLFGKIMAMSFSDSINTGNPLANLVFYYTALIALFLPANNQIGQGFNTLFSMILALVWWSRSRKGKPYNKFKIILGKHHFTLF